MTVRRLVDADHGGIAKRIFRRRRGDPDRPQQRVAPLKSKRDPRRCN
jgi:hypothetical protein